MPPDNDRGVATVAIVSGDLQVVFVRSGDRFAHHIAAVAGGHAPLLASVEGKPDDPWPSSSPWQELHVERRGELEVALLVGRAGRSHWSMSVEPNLAAGGFVFDVACRTSGDVGFLGSTYRLADAISPAQDGNAICFAAAYELRGVSGDIVLSSDNRVLQILPPRPAPRSPQTIRWQYSLLSVDQ